MSNKIELKHITKQFDNVKVMDGLSLDVNEGEIVGILGPSGCGKTTLLRVIAGLEYADSGIIIIDGEVIGNKVEPSKRGVALVMQEPVLWGHMSVFKNATYGMKDTDSKEIREHIVEVFSNLGLSGLEKRKPSKISGGQAKRVSLARAILADKDILLLDEPLSNVDEEAKNLILNYIRAKIKGRKTILYVSHDEEELNKICDRVVIFREGRLEDR